MSNRRFLPLASLGFLILCFCSITGTINYLIVGDWTNLLYVMNNPLYRLLSLVGRVSILGLFLIALGYGLNGLASRNLISLAIGLFAGISFLYSLFDSYLCPILGYGNVTMLLSYNTGLSIMRVTTILSIIAVIRALYFLFLAIRVKSVNKLLACLLLVAFVYVGGLNSVVLDFLQTLLSLPVSSTIPYVISNVGSFVCNLLGFFASRMNTEY